jgi:hypothetical protein
MTSAELTRRAKLQEWSARIQDCRSSGLSAPCPYGLCRRCQIQRERRRRRIRHRVPRLQGQRLGGMRSIPPASCKSALKDHLHAYRKGHGRYPREHHSRLEYESLSHGGAVQFRFHHRQPLCHAVQSRFSRRPLKAVIFHVRFREKGFDTDETPPGIAGRSMTRAFRPSAPRCFCRCSCAMRFRRSICESSLLVLSGSVYLR